MTPKSSVDRVRVSANAPAPPASDADRGKHERPPDNHPQYRAALGAERHANADFAHAPGDVVAQHPVDPDRPERERQRGEQSDEQHREPAFGHRARYRPIERLEREHRQRGIALADDVAHRRCRGERIAGRPHEQYAGAVD